MRVWVRGSGFEWEANGEDGGGGGLRFMLGPFGKRNRGGLWKNKEEEDDQIWVMKEGRIDSLSFVRVEVVRTTSTVFYPLVYLQLAHYRNYEAGFFG